MICVYDNENRTYVLAGRLSDELKTLVLIANAPVSAYVREHEGTLHLVDPSRVTALESALVPVYRYTFEKDEPTPPTKSQARLALARDVADLRNALQPLFELAEVSREANMVDASIVDDAEASKTRILALLKAIELHSKP